MIEEAAAARAARVDRGEDVIVGVNKYRLAEEAAIDILDVDNHAVREAQIARIERDEGGARRGDVPRRRWMRCARARGATATCWRWRSMRARARATLGEIILGDGGRVRRYGTNRRRSAASMAAPMTAMPAGSGWSTGVAATERRLGRKPRMLVAKMGQDGHDRGANLVSQHVRRSRVRGRPGPLFQTPQEAAALAIDSDVDVVGASSLAAGHKTLIPELIGHLRDAGRADIKVIAGGVIPAQDYDFLREAGVQAIFGPGTNLIKAAEEVLRLLGHNMPPESEAAE